MTIEAMQEKDIKKKMNVCSVGNTFLDKHAYAIIKALCLTIIIIHKLVAPVLRVDLGLYYNQLKSASGNFC